MKSLTKSFLTKNFLFIIFSLSHFITEKAQPKLGVYSKPKIILTLQKGRFAVHLDLPCLRFLNISFCIFINLSYYQEQVLLKQLLKITQLKCSLLLITYFLLLLCHSSDKKLSRKNQYIFFFKIFSWLFRLLKVDIFFKD